MAITVATLYFTKYIVLYHCSANFNAPEQNDSAFYEQIVGGKGCLGLVWLKPQHNCMTMTHCCVLNYIKSDVELGHKQGNALWRILFLFAKAIFLFHLLPDYCKIYKKTNGSLWARRPSITQTANISTKVI